MSPSQEGEAGFKRSEGGFKIEREALVVMTKDVWRRKVRNRLRAGNRLKSHFPIEEG
jgi:hypothetical protein